MSMADAGSARGVEVALLSGDRMQFDRFELPRALVHRYMLLFYVILTVALSQLQLYELIKSLSPAGRLTVVAATQFAGIASILFVLICVELLQKPGTRIVLSASLFAYCAAGISTIVSEFFVASPPKDTLSGMIHFVVIWGSIYVITEIGIHYVMLQIMPRALRDLRGVDGRAMRVAKLPGRRIEIKGQLFFPEEILRISAEGNYIRVVTRSTAHFLPGPFGPVAEGLPPEMGLQVSRSDWVGAMGVTGLRKDGREVWVEMSDGISVRVAQSRRKAVVEWEMSLRRGGV